MDRDTLAFLALLGGLALTLREVVVLWRQGGDAAENNDFQLQQNQALSRQRDQERREYRRLERDYQALASWGVMVLRILARCAPDEKVPEMPLRSINGETMAPLTDADEVRLRRVLVERLSADEIRSAAFDLGAEDLRGTTTSEMARALLDYVRQRRGTARLVAWLAENRPDIEI